MVKVGDVALKIAGRDAGQLCVVIDTVDDNNVLIDGMTRRRKCNASHLEFLGTSAKIKKGASTKDVRQALSDLGFKLKETKKGEKRKAAEKPKRLRKKASQKISKTVGGDDSSKKKTSKKK